MKKNTLIVISLSSMLFLAACSKTQALPAPTQAPSRPAYFLAQGQLLPVTSVDLSFQTPGQVRDVPVKDGQTVAAGQVLATLSGAPGLSAALERAKQEETLARLALQDLQASAGANLAQSQLAAVKASQDLEAAQYNYDANTTSLEYKASLDLANAKVVMAQDQVTKITTAGGLDPDTLAAAQARTAAAQAARESAQIALDNLTLQSPIDGTVVDVRVKSNEMVPAAQSVVTVADLSSWIVATDNVTEIDVVRVIIGQTVEVTLDALPGTVLKGQITHINTRFEEKRGDITYTVTIKLLDTDPQMRWGMTAAVKFLP
ncbi:MAG: efflux RND transporter periplasmic adaptor subunit [Chloroflexi bacterium]|nr:efflux RND transporter periplasmic adaptor subunit [Chloroflexota bacterium]